MRLTYGSAKVVVLKRMLVLAGFLSIGAFLRAQEASLKGRDAPFEVVTPQGTFSAQRVQTQFALHFYLRWNGKLVLDEDNDSEVSVVSDSGAGRNRLMLLAFGSQGEDCPAFYRVLDFASPEPSLSKEFGNCSDEPLVHARPHSLRVIFGKFRYARQASWTYTQGSHGAGTLVKRP